MYFSLKNKDHMYNILSQIVLNKIDLLPKERILKRISEIKNLYNFEEIFLISAKNGSGCNKLIKYLANKMPAHSFFYDENTITDLKMVLAYLKKHNELKMVYDSYKELLREMLQYKKKIVYFYALMNPVVYV